MAELPRATVQLDQQAGAGSTGTDLLTVIACVSKNPDMMPRIFSSTSALLDKHDYAQGVDYAALHFEETKRPIIFIGLPIATPGTIGTPDTAGNSGTSIVSVDAGPSGVLEDCDVIVKIAGAVGAIFTVGTDQIMLELSLDGGYSRKNVRLGTATSYTVAYFGFILNFAVGTLKGGDTVLTFSTKAPRWDADGIAAARTALASQQKLSRNWHVIGDIDDVADAQAILAEINAYATENDRCSLARVAVRDRDAETEEDADWVAAIESEFETIDGEMRIDMGAGRGFKKSAIHNWFLRRNAAWAASLREYVRDVQIPTWRKSDGVLSGWSLEKDGVKVEHDERTDGGLLLARFTCLRSFANGPVGTFVAMSLTRAEEGSLLSRTHNAHVANLTCNVAQAETENAIGTVLELNENGTATESALAVLEGRVNSRLAIELLQARADGKRANDATWKATRGEILNVPGAKLTGVVDLRLGGTLEQLHTSVRVDTAG